LLESFSNNKVGSFACVVVVNLLYKKLPYLVLVVYCICNCFNSAWIRNQWEIIDKLWGKDCLAIVGPIIKHANNGDSDRRQLMLAYYKSVVGTHLIIGWDNWMFRVSLDINGDATCLHDQDYIYNNKKSINPLLSAIRTLQLERFVSPQLHRAGVPSIYG